METKYWHPELSNLGKFTIGDGCIVHSHVWIGDGVVIGNRCKIQAFAFLPPGVVLGNDVFVGPHVCFTNTKHPPSNERLITVVEDGVAIGANSTILPGIRIGKGAKIGAGSVVTKDVPPGVTVVGNPARVHGAP